MYRVKITESMNFVDLFCGIWKISLARYVGLVYKGGEKESLVYFFHVTPGNRVEEDKRNFSLEILDMTHFFHFVPSVSS